MPACTAAALSTRGFLVCCHSFLHSLSVLPPVLQSLSKDADQYDNTVGHVELAKKMKKRDPATAPQTGDRIPYVIIKAAKVGSHGLAWFFCCRAHQLCRGKWQKRLVQQGCPILAIPFPSGHMHCAASDMCVLQIVHSPLHRLLGAWRLYVMRGEAISSLCVPLKAPPAGLSITCVVRC